MFFVENSGYMTGSLTFDRHKLLSREYSIKMKYGVGKRATGTSP